MDTWSWEWRVTPCPYHFQSSKDWICAFCSCNFRFCWVLGLSFQIEDASGRDPSLGSTELKLPILSCQFEFSKRKRWTARDSSDDPEEAGLLFLNTEREECVWNLWYSWGVSWLPCAVITVNRHRRQPQPHVGKKPRAQILRIKVSITPLAEVLAYG